MTQMIDRAELHPYFKRRLYAPSSLHERATGSGPWSVPDLCAAYQWPTNLAGGGVIAIVELGGGWTKPDLEAFCKQAGVPMPLVTDVSVDGTKNTPGQDADGEVALDVQIAAAGYSVATGGKPATIRVYWANDIAPAVRAAAKDGCDVCSISWGADEANWGKAAAEDMEAAAMEAAQAGMMIFAASGDNDSSDGGTSAANVDLPAGCPHIVGCGGTNKTRSSEVVWNDAPGNASGDGTGGGYSTIFPMPQWQAQNHAPSGPGRLVPDVAGNADPNTGYQIFLNGSWQVFGGTSAVAPLYAGLFGACGKKLGFVGDKLWKNPGAFTDITHGDNGMFHAQVGPDPCTGLGAPIGKRIDSLFVTAPPAPGPMPTPIPNPQPPGQPHPSAPLTLAEAIAAAESALPNAFMTRAMVMKYIEQGLKKHWPAGAP